MVFAGLPDDAAQHLRGAVSMGALETIRERLKCDPEEAWIVVGSGVCMALVRELDAKKAAMLRSGKTIIVSDARPVLHIQGALGAPSNSIQVWLVWTVDDALREEE